jgi:single-stranded-DNA-specific exonuclease
MTPVTSITHSISGLAWRWRGGNMDMSGRFGAMGGLSDDLVDQLLLSRGVPHDDLERHRRPTLRDFLPDPSLFRDMDVAARRLADAVVRGEAITVYGDYDVDGATSAALLLRLLRALGVEGQAYIPTACSKAMALGRGAGAAGARRQPADRHRRLRGHGARGAGPGARCGDRRDRGRSPQVLARAAPAVALVNPNRLDEADEAAAHGHLAAVGVAFLLAVATVRVLRARGWFDQRPVPDLMALLDLVAWAPWPTWRSSRASTAHSWRKG